MLVKLAIALVFAKKDSMVITAKNLMTVFWDQIFFHAKMVDLQMEKQEDAPANAQKGISETIVRRLSHVQRIKIRKSV